MQTTRVVTEFLSKMFNSAYIERECKPGGAKKLRKRPKGTPVREIETNTQYGDGSSKLGDKTLKRKRSSGKKRG